MKKFFILSLIILSSSGLIFAQITQPPSGDNQKAVVTQYIGSIVHVTITYNSPDITSPSGKDRTGKIWGQLVPQGLTDLGFGLQNPSPWRAGANENTTVKFSHDVLVQGEPLAAGTYGLHVIVEESGPWTIIFSNNSTAWGSYFYDDAEDELRVQVTPEKSEFHEWLTYEFIDRQPNFTVAALKWENIQLPFRIEVSDMDDLYVNTIRKELQSSPGFTWINWVTAVNYCLQNDLNLEEALQWAETAISKPFIGAENFTTLEAKAKVLHKLNRLEEMQKTMDKAIHHPTAASLDIHGYGRQLISMGEKKKAMEIFEYNAKKENGAWPTNVGIARGYSAIGEYDKALKYAKMALEQAPDQLNKDNLTNAIEMLKNKKDIN